MLDINDKLNMYVLDVGVMKMLLKVLYLFFICIFMGIMLNFGMWCIGRGLLLLCER